LSDEMTAHEGGKESHHHHIYSCLTFLSCAIISLLLLLGPMKQYNAR